MKERYWLNNKIRAQFVLSDSSNGVCAFKIAKDIRALLLYLASHNTRRGILEVSYKFSSGHTAFSIFYGVIYVENEGWHIKAYDKDNLINLETDLTYRTHLLHRAVKIRFWEPHSLLSYHKKKNTFSKIQLTYRLPLQQIKK